MDALCTRDGDTAFNGSSLEKLAFSFKAGSPSLVGPNATFGTAYNHSPADVFRVGLGDAFPGSGLQVPFLTAAFLSLEHTDKLDALDCRLGDYGSLHRRPTPTPPLSRQLRVHLPLIGRNWSVSAPQPTATATHLTTEPAQPTFPATPTGSATSHR